MKRPLASELKPDASQFVGMLNAEKCIVYLRGIGADVDDATADSWMDAQAAHRLLRKMKRPKVTGWDWWCDNAHTTYVEVKRGRRRKHRPELETCHCGAAWRYGSRRYDVAIDGTVSDYHDKEERWKPLDAPPTGEMPR